MRVIIFKKSGQFCAAVAGVCLLAVILVNLVGYFLGCEHISVFAAAKDSNKYEVRSRLLMEAMDSVGVYSPEDAAMVWASGLEKRSAALQYSVMSKELKERYAEQLEESAPNWVTGVSSPWIDSYRIVRIEEPNENTRIIELSFSTMTSTGPAGTYNATLTITRDGDFWRITEIVADPELYPYTRFNP